MRLRLEQLALAFSHRFHGWDGRAMGSSRLSHPRPQGRDQTSDPCFYNVESMRSTLSSPVPPYVGADLTDRYSGECRDIDVCGLTPSGAGRLVASFWRWQWDPAPHVLDVAVIANELSSARVAMLDGPQALASIGAALRVCERQSAAVGKTPDARPDLRRPFAGFICSSLDLFNALGDAGIPISAAAGGGGMFEVYPGHIWTMFRAGFLLPNKTTRAGRLSRKSILEVLGVTNLPDLPTHDENDACIASVLAAAADNGVPGVAAMPIGAPLSLDPDGTRREGPMVVPAVDSVIVDRIAGAINNLGLSSSSRRTEEKAGSALPDTGADGLLADFITRATAGDPEVCTYAWAYRFLAGSVNKKFSQAYARQLIELASRTAPRDLPGLGLVHLDAFIVSKKDRVPSEGHWRNAQYDREEWVRVLGNARLLE